MGTALLAAKRVGKKRVGSQFQKSKNGGGGIISTSALNETLWKIGKKIENRNVSISVGVGPDRNGGTQKPLKEKKPCADFPSTDSYVGRIGIILVLTAS